MKKQLPEGFKSWIEFYDNLQKNFPHLLKGKSLRMINGRITHDNKDISLYSCRIDTILINCWKELQALRLDENHTVVAVHNIANVDYAGDMRDKIITLLAHLEK